MALSADELRFAIDDARHLLKADVELIGAIDKQAISFLQLFVTLSGAAIAASGGLLLSSPRVLPASLAVGLLTFGIFTFVAAMLSLRVLWADDISLPGREADFWLWADRDDVGFEMACRQYLNDLAGKAQRNRALNSRMSLAMQHAKIAGAAAPFIGVAAALIAHQII